MIEKIAIEEAFQFNPPEAPIDPKSLADWLSIDMSYFADRWDRLLEFDERRISAMDSAGVKFSVLSHTSPGPQGILKPAEAESSAKAINDFLATRIAEHPDKYAGFAALSLHNGENAAAELRRSVEELGFVGALVNGYNDSPDGELYLDDERYEPLWSELERLDVPLYIHPRTPGGDWSAIRNAPYLVGATWGFAPETASHLLRIIFSGVLDRHPKLNIVIGHLGEGLLTTLERTQVYFENNPHGRSTERTLQEYFSRNIHVTTSGNFNDQALSTALHTVGADNLIFSVDYPYADSSYAGTWFDRTPISERDRVKIAWDNAVQLLHLEAKGLHKKL